MAFAMKGGVSRAIDVFFKNVFFKNHLELFPDCQKMFYT